MNLHDPPQLKNVSNLDTPDDCENDLRLNYKTPGHPIAFSGITNIYNYYKRKLSQNKIKEILSTIESYTLHKGFRSAQRNSKWFSILPKQNARNRYVNQPKSNCFSFSREL